MLADFTIIWLNWNIEIILLFSLILLTIIYLFNFYFKYDNTDIIYICLYIFIIMFYILIRADILEGTFYIHNNYFIYNEFYNLVKKFLIFCMICYLILLNNFNNIIKLPIFEYLILVIICLFGICMIIKSNHLFIIFLFLELVNLCIYCLIGLNKDSNMGIESAYKYFVQSSLATIIGFFGVSLVYVSTGTLFLNELNILISFESLSYLTILGIYLIITSVLFKLGIFPLHSWIPEVYQGTLLISLVFIAIIPKIAYVILFLKLYTEFHTIIHNYCLILSGISVIYGSLISLYQTSFRRLLAYGSMVHLGLIVFIICVFTIQSITAGLFYLFTYIMLMLFTFCFMFFLFEKKDDKLTYLDDISKFHIYFADNILLLIFYGLIIFSLAGLPFFIGFISKWYIFISLIGYFNIFEVLIYLSVSILSSSYYIRLLRFFYFSFKVNKIKRYSIIKFDMLFYNLIMLLFMINLFTIVYHNIIFLIIFKYVLILFC